MKTINIIANYSSFYAGNFIPSLLHLAKDLDLTYKVVFSFPKQAEERFWCQKIKSDGFDVFFYGEHVIKDLRKINKKINASLLYTHFLSNPIVKLLSPFSKKRKLLIHVHSDFSGGKQKFSFSKSLKKLIFEKLLRRDTQYVYVSESLKNEDKHKHSFYVRNALANDRIISTPLDKNAFKKCVNYKDDKIHFLVFGWSPFVKGIDVAVNAFNKLPSEIKEKVQLLLVHNYNKKEEIQEYINKHCSQPQFDLLLCEPVEDIFGLYLLNDVFISSSRSEGFSYSILEALYCGLPVLASDIDGTAWSKKYGALTFSTENPDDLASKVMQFQCKTKKLSEFNQSILNDFSLAEWSSKISNIIQKNF